MLAIFSKLLFVSSLLAQVMVASHEHLPTNFESVYSEPSRSRMYGCVGNYNKYSLSLDLVNNRYTQVHSVCGGRGMSIWGERGTISFDNHQIIKTHTEWGSVNENEDDTPITWTPIYHHTDGYFIFDEVSQIFNEFNENGDFIRRWEANASPTF